MRNNSFALLKVAAIAFGLLSIIMTSCASTNGCKGLSAHPKYKASWAKR